MTSTTSTTQQHYTHREIVDRFSPYLYRDGDGFYWLDMSTVDSGDGYGFSDDAGPGRGAGDRIGG